MATQLEGVAALTKKLKALGNAATGQVLRGSVREALSVARQRAKQYIPVGTVEHRTHKGRLVAPGFAKRSIRLITTVSKDKQMAAAILGVRAEAFYAVQFVEFGTAKMGARPWLRPAFRGSKNQQLEKFASSMRKRIEKVARS